jgi:hypothetical protein
MFLHISCKPCFKFMGNEGGFKMWPNSFTAYFCNQIFKVIHVNVSNMSIHCLFLNYSQSTFSTLLTFSDYLGSLGLKSALKVKMSPPPQPVISITLIFFMERIFKPHPSKCNPRNISTLLTKLHNLIWLYYTFHYLCGWKYAMTIHNHEDGNLLATFN